MVKFSQIQFILAALCVSVFAAEIPGPASEVKMLQGRPTFFIDDKPVTKPLLNIISGMGKERKLLVFRQMTDIGVDTFSIFINCGKCPYGIGGKPVWISQNQWDFSQIDEFANDLISVNPNAYIFIAINITEPEWWLKQNPDQLCVFSDGSTVLDPPALGGVQTYGCLASEKYRTDMAMSLSKTIDHIQNSKWAGHVVGYIVQGLQTLEWYHWAVHRDKQMADYNPIMQQAFREHLKKKYTDEKSLQFAWSEPNITFDKIKIPSAERRSRKNTTFRNPKTEMDVIDYSVFYSDIVAQTIDYFAAVIKKQTNGKKAVGTFYDYMLEFTGNPEFGHNSGRLLLTSPNIDFIAAPPSYYQRQIGSGQEGYRRPFFSGTLHGKLWYHDNDNGSFLTSKILKSYPEMLAQIEQQLKPPKTAKESDWLYQRSAGFTIAEGVYENYFDLHGGYYDHPSLLYPLKHINEMLDRSKNYDRSSAAEILVVVDANSLSYCTYQQDEISNPHGNRINQALLSHQTGFIKCGAPYDSILLYDLPLVNIEQYKFIAFINVFNVTGQMREFIDRNLKKDNKTILWTYAPGIFNFNSRSNENIHSLTGINIIESDDESFIKPVITLNQNAAAFLKNNDANMPESPIVLDPVLDIIPIMDNNNKKICKLFYVCDQNSETLGTLADSNTAVFAKKNFKNWTCVYSLIPSLPPQIIAAIAKSAGVHIYSNLNDTLYANKSYIVINASGSGIRTIKLPHKADVYNALTENKWFENVREFDVSLINGETQIFRLEKN